MNLHTLPSVTKRKKKRLGQGYGSGRGKTAGRGTKGQKARSNIPLHFNGADLSILERLPFRRGKQRNKSFKNKPIVINVKILNLLKKNSIVDINTVVKHHFVLEKDAARYGVKILGDGELQIPLTVKLPVSKGAKEKIEKAGGTVVT